MKTLAIFDTGMGIFGIALLFIITFKNYSIEINLLVAIFSVITIRNAIYLWFEGNTK